jgi:predicted branched-subunit amino acid permease
MAPMIVGLAPFALVIGATAAREGAAFAGWTGSWLVFGGSAHLATLNAVNSGLAVAVATGLIVNARLLVYSASLRPQWAAQPTWFRAVAAAMVVDPTWAIARHPSDARTPSEERAFFLGAALALGTCWSAFIALGAFAGASAGGLDLDVAVPVCLGALVGPALRDPADRGAAAVGAGVVLVTASWPANTGVLAAIALGGAAGALLDAPRREQVPT